MNLVIRKMKPNEYKELEEFLYQAIFIPEGVSPLPRSILKDPNLSIYISDFGKNKDDHSLVAEIDKKIVGAVWVRIMNDYGHVDDSTPSMSISVLKEYRGLGIGKKLIKEMLNYLKEKGYKQVSLSVQKDNFASDMYKNLGFKIYRENEEDYIMVYKL